MPETKLLEERNWMTSRRTMGRSKRPMGLKNSDTNSVNASLPPLSPRTIGIANNNATTTVKSIPWGTSALVSFNIVVVVCFVFVFVMRDYLFYYGGWFLFKEREDMEIYEWLNLRYI